MNVLYLLPSYNLYGGTPKKTLDLIKHSSNQCFLYVWSTDYANEFKQDFIECNTTIYDHVSGRNVFKHILSLLKIIDKHNIQIIQSQFFFGELLAGLIKVLRPKIKIVIAFVGSMSPGKIKRSILKPIYRKVDAFVYISKYVKKEKEHIFPKLKKSNSVIIYNGTTPLKLKDNSEILNLEQDFNILCVSGLTKIKNIQVLIDCMGILLKNGHESITFLIAGDGPEKENFENQIRNKKLSKNFKLLGYKKDIGNLLSKAHVYVHPCYIEGFGIAVAEAMMAKKPIIVSNAGALPELITNQQTGLIVDPFAPQEWANAIIKLKEDKALSLTLAEQAKWHAERSFSIKNFVSNYNQLYKTLIN